jgi:hypothetical protein
MFIDEASITVEAATPQHRSDFRLRPGRQLLHRDGATSKASRPQEGDRRRLKSGNDPLSVAQCVWIAIEVAKGLHYAHTKEYKGQPLNIVHRDVTRRTTRW